jgi:putative transposase
MKYIEMNPVRAKIASMLEDYRWSSYKFHAFGQDEDKILDCDPVYSSLANTTQGRQKAYRDFSALEQDKDVIEAIRKSIVTDSILGSDSFIDKLKNQLSLSKPRLRGRPRKIINS